MLDVDAIDAMVPSFSPLTSPIASRCRPMPKLASSSSSAAAAVAAFASPAASTSASAQVLASRAPATVAAPTLLQPSSPPQPAFLSSPASTSPNSQSTVPAARPARVSAITLTPEEIRLIEQQVEERKVQPIRGLPKAAVCPQAYARLCDGFDLEPLLDHFHVTSTGAVAHVGTDVSQELLGMSLPIAPRV